MSVVQVTPVQGNRTEVPPHGKFKVLLHNIDLERTSERNVAWVHDIHPFV